MPQKIEDNLQSPMTDDMDKLSRIEAFVEGTLSQKDRDAMEAQRRDDPVLDAAIYEFEQIREGIVEAGKEELRQKIREWEASESARSDAGSSSLRKAAAVLIVVGCAAGLYTLLQNTGRNSLESDALEMFTPYPNVTAERGSTPANVTDSIFMLYEDGQYDQIIEMFENQRPYGNDLEGLRDFYLAESFIAGGRYLAAADILSEFDDRSHALYEVARFHHALALILAEKYEEAEDKLEIIRSEKGPYRAQAETLLKQME